jgi:predicted transcriptional regulator
MNRRNRLEIIGDILTMADKPEGINLTDILISGSRQMSHNQVQDYTNKLKELGHLEKLNNKNRSRYRTCESGRNFNRALKEFKAKFPKLFIQYL